jgi:hypothetical protein
MNTDELQEAIAIRKQLVADRERLLGPDHPDILIAKVKLQEFVYVEHVAGLGLGRKAEEQLAADCARVLGPDHPDTLSSWALMQSYRWSGCADWSGSGGCLSMEAEGQLVDDCMRILGPDHPATRTIRESCGQRWGESVAPPSDPSWIW